MILFTPTSSPLRHHLLRNAANLALLALLLALAWNIFRDPGAQGDVRLRHYAIKVWRAGGNPYSPADINRAGYKTDLAYIYPPDTLPVYALFHTFNGVDTARTVYLVWQLALLAGLLVCWRRWLLDAGDGSHPLLLAFCLLGLDNTLLVDLRTGNISLLEQALLWLGLAAWLRGRDGWFCVLLWLAAACKLTLLAFSVLLLLPPARQWVKFALVWAAMGARLWLDYLVSPRLFMDFVGALTGGFGGSHEMGQNNPCLPALLRDLFLLGDDAMTDDEMKGAMFPVYAVLVAVVLGLSWWAWRTNRRRRRGPGAQRHRRTICLVCFAYALTVPRMKDYSYILLLLPVWMTCKRTLARQPQAWLAVVAFACLASYSTFGAVEAFYLVVWSYWPYMVTLAAWILLLSDAFRKTPAVTLPPAAASP